MGGRSKATEPMVEAADFVTIVGPNAAKETSVEAIEPRRCNPGCRARDPE
jgi:hypothetical protein